MNPFFSYGLSWIIFLTLICFQNSLFAQNEDVCNGYYISSSGDSLTGQIHHGAIRHNVLKFRSSDKDPWANLSPELVLVVAGEKDLFVFPEKIQASEGAEYIFVKRILNGGYSLYQGYTSSGSVLFFVQLPERQNLVKINPLGYKSQMKSLLDSCGQQLATINLRYNVASLSKYLVQANQCAFPGKKIASLKNKIKPRFGVGLSAMYYNINPKVGGLSIFSSDYQNVGRFNGAVSARLEITPAISFHLGLNYMDKRIKGDSVLLEIGYTREVPGIPTKHAINYYRFAPDLNFTYWEIPIGLTHSFLPYGKLSPSYSLGFAVQIPNKQKVEHDWGYPVCPDEKPCYLPPGESAHISPTWTKSYKYAWVNFFVGLGLRKTLKSQNEWEVRVDYFNQFEKAKVGTNKSGVRDLFMKTSRFQLSLNYYFYFNKRSK